MNDENRPDDAFKDEILREQIRLAMCQIPTMQATSFVVALALSYGIHSIVSRVHIIAWLLMVLVIVLGRVALFQRFRHVREGPFEGEHWRNAYLILALISGIIWGSSAFLIFPSGHPELISLFVLVIASLSAATTISHSSIRLAPAGWSGPALALYAIRCTMEWTELGYTISFLVVLYLYTIIRYSFTHHASVTSVISFKFENLVLLKELQKVNDLLRQDIVERKRSEDALKRAREEWEITFDAVPDLIAILDDRHRIIRINRAMGERLGMSVERLCGRACYEIFHGTTSPPQSCPHSMSLADGCAHAMEISLDRLKGDFLVSVSPLHDPQGHLMGSVHVARDITQSKRAERALKVSHAFLTISHRHEELAGLMEEFSTEIKAVAGCNAVGIRVMDEGGQDVWSVCDGFQYSLSVIDGWLSLRAGDCSSGISPSTESVPSEPTAGYWDSLFLNKTSSLPVCDSGAIPYESVGRIAIRSQNRLLGFIYAADEREDMFSQELLALLENGAMHMGTAIQKALAQGSLKLAHQELERRVEERTQALTAANELLGAEILERKRIEHDLRRESAFREAVIANAKEGLCVWHLIEDYPYVRFTVWNRSMEEITGYSMEEINRLGWVYAMYEDPEMRTQVLDAMKNLKREDRLSRLVRSIKRADGKRRSIIISSAPIQFQEDQEHVIALLQDITELQEAEHALRQSERQFRGLVENIQVGIHILKDGIIVYQNPEQERLLGGCLTTPYTLWELLEMLHPDDRRAFDKLCVQCPSDVPASSEAIVRLVPPGDGKDEPIRWASCRCTAIEYRGEQAKLIHMMDITPLRDLERLVIQQEKMASLGHVAAGIAHDIRNPLSGINVYLDAIRDCFQDPESADDVMRLIQEAQATSNKIESVIRRVLDFSRPADLKMRLISINEVVHEAVKLYAVSLRKASIILDLDLEPELQRVYADSQLMEQVMVNLIANAADILKSLHGERRIRISTWMKNRYVHMRVEDSGPGIPEELRTRVFEPFFTTRSQGMGIGLGICKRVVANHRGDIHISTSQMGGAQFDISIPAEKRSEGRWSLSACS